MKICRVCGIKLTNENKTINKQGNICKICESRRGFTEYQKVFNNKTKRIRSWAVRTLINHRNKGYKMLITIDELCNYASLINNCEYTGIELNWFSKGKCNFNSPSLDRVDNEKEIRLDNIRIVSHRANTMKGNLTFKEYIQYCKHMIDKFGSVLNEIK
jgi:hypothetical protein